MIESEIREDEARARSIVERRADRRSITRAETETEAETDVTKTATGTERSVIATRLGIEADPKRHKNASRT